MKNNERLEIVTEREYKVVKANEIIQKARFELGILEQKTFGYAVSKIKPGDPLDKEYVFSINEYCDICGINRNDGRTIKNVKSALKKLRDKSFYLFDEKGDYVLIGWLSKARVNPKSGLITIKFDEDMKKYLIGLYTNYTQYSLLCILPMRSSYSIRLYELLKSFSGFSCKEFDIDDLQMKLCSHYKRFPDFRRKVLEVATKEINLYTDIEILWLPIKKSRKIVKVKFDIKKREGWNYCSNMYRSNYKLDNKENPY